MIAGGGGFVPGIIYHPKQPGLVYARTDIGGAYRWDGGTDRWIPLTDSMSRDLQGADFMGILSVALDPSDTNRVYMETGKYTQSWAGNGALLSSTNRGASWTIIPLSMKVGGNEDGRGCGERLQVDPNADSILIMGASSNSGTSPAQAGLWKSTNFGTSWSPLSSFLPANVNFVLFDPSSSPPGIPTSRIFVAAVNTSGQSLYESTDAGTNWGVVSGQPIGVMAIRAVIADSLLYVTFANYQGPNNATTGSVWKYNIVKSLWTNISPSSGSYGFSGISLYPKNPNDLAVSTLDCWSPMDEVYLSTDGGAHWAGRLRNAKLDHSYAPYTSTVNPHWLGCLAMDPFDSSKAMFGTGFGIWACDNLFSLSPTWYFRDEDLEETVPLQIISPPFTNVMSALGDYNGFRHDSLDASPPQGRYSLPSGTQTSISFASRVPSKVATTYNSLPYGAYSTDGGTTWHNFSNRPSGTNGGGSFSIAVSADGNSMVWSPSGGTLSYSTDNGKSWTKSRGSMPSDPPVADPVNPKKFYVFDAISGGRVWVSKDGGESFAQGAGGLPIVPSYQSQDGLVTTVPGHEGDLWICTGAGGLYHSTSSGTSASKINSVGSAYLLGSGKSSSKGGYPSLYLWGVVNGALGIFRSDDVGMSWTRINDDSHQFGYLHQVAGDPRVYGRCYVATEGRGILFGEPANSDTTDNPTTFNFLSTPSDSLRHSFQVIGIKWSRASDRMGIPLTYILHFSGPGVDTTLSTIDSEETFSVGNIQSNSRYSLTGFVTNGFDTTASANATWLNSAMIITDVKQPTGAPEGFVLNQNFPNPFNPSTIISYQLPVSGQVTLKVYDALGREIKSLVDAVEESGTHEIRFDASKFASGVYFCYFQAGDFVQIRKLTLIK